MSIAHRRYHRIKMDAQVLLSLGNNPEASCRCIDFSEDGIDLEFNSNEHSLQISVGSIVNIRFDQVDEAPEVKAAVIKVSPNHIGLRLL